MALLINIVAVRDEPSRSLLGSVFGLLAGSLVLAISRIDTFVACWASSILLLRGVLRESIYGDVLDAIIRIAFAMALLSYRSGAGWPERSATRSWNDSSGTSASASRCSRCGADPHPGQSVLSGHAPSHVDSLSFSAGHVPPHPAVERLVRQSSNRRSSHFDIFDRRVSVRVEFAVVPAQDRSAARKTESRA